MKHFCGEKAYMHRLLTRVINACGVMLFALSLMHCSQTNWHAPLLSSSINDERQPIEIAFLADVHLHDIYAAPKTLSTDISSQRVKAENTGSHQRFPLDSDTQAPLLMRSMQAQLTSTRLFNENYFVFRAALDSIAKRGIKLVALPGDFSDDGQPANIKALAKILDEYYTRYGMRFFAITGNHDPVRPFSRPGGKPNFLDADGKEVAVYSPDHARCKDKSAWLCTNDIREWGYQEIMQTLKHHGFSSQSQDLLYETPFNSNELDKRGWNWCDSEACIFMPDASYLVEPVKGVWLLAIDANVYIPKGDYAHRNFSGSGNAGYNALLTYKPQLLTWIKQIVQRAKTENKRLIAFSHFPMADFYDDTQPQLEHLFGVGSNQLKRMPLATTTAALSATGLSLHMAGHMHLYDVAVSADNQGLVNVQVPSLAAYQPGYSIVTLSPHNEAKVQTVIQKNVAHFDTLFPVYYREWQQRQQHGQPLWNKNILSSQDYLEFTEAHLKEVVRQRYVGKEWPQVMARYIKQHTVGEVFSLAYCLSTADNLPDDIASLPAIVLAYDYYKLRNAGAFADIAGREKWYRENISETSLSTCHASQKNELQRLLAEFLRLLRNAAHVTDPGAITVKGV